MTSRLACIAVLSGLLAGAAPAAAGDLTLVIRNGRVNLTARGVSARQILAEWARIGQTRILNGDRVVGPPLTLQLNGVSEREALDIILRSVSGYMAVARPVGIAGTSVFDRILIMPASSNAPLAQMAPAPPPRMPNMQPPMESAPQTADEDGIDQMDQPQDVPDPNGPGGGLQPGNPYGRGGFPAVLPGANRPPLNPNNVNIPALTTDEEPAPDNEPVSPNPWNVTGGSSLPGVISQPQTPNPNPGSPNPPQGAD